MHARTSTTTGLALALGLAVLSGAAPAAAAEATYAGAIYVTAVSPGCAVTDWSVGDTGTFVLGWEGGVRSIGWINSRSALSFIPKGQVFKGSGIQQVTYINSKGAVSKYKGTFSDFRLTPSRLGPDVDSMTLTAKFDHMGGVKKCSITVLAAAAKRPD